jgi:hypothetical protein
LNVGSPPFNQWGVESRVEVGELPPALFLGKKEPRRSIAIGFHLRLPLSPPIRGHSASFAVKILPLILRRSGFALPHVEPSCHIGFRATTLSHFFKLLTGSF